MTYTRTRFHKSFQQLVLISSITCAAVSARADSTAVFAGDRITVTAGGAGKDVILIPGLACSGAVWDASVKQLSPTCRVHVVLIAGFAGSAPRANAQGPIIELVVDALHAYIKTNGLKSPSLIGHSLGGLIGMKLAIEHPEDLSKLMIVDALPFYGLIMGITNGEQAKPMAAVFRDSMIAQTPEAFALNETNFLRFLVKSPEGRQKAIAWAIASDRSVVARAMYEDMITDVRPGLADIHIPVTILYPWDTSSGYSQAATDGFYREPFAQLANKTMVRIDGSYHFIMFDAPDQLAKQIGGFVK